MDHDFKDPYNFTYFVGLLGALLIATLPASLTLIGMFTR
jgi:hypothetical protein